MRAIKDLRVVALRYEAKAQKQINEEKRMHYEILAMEIYNRISEMKK